MSLMWHAIFLAWKDYWHEKLLSLCSILGLAALLCPLLVFIGVHQGIIGTMQDRLLHDPKTLEVTPVGSGKYTPEWFQKMREHPGVDFIVPQTRSIAATVTLRSEGEENPNQAYTPLIATALNDPLLERWKVRAPVFNAVTAELPEAAQEQIETDSTDFIMPEAVLSQTTAHKLQVQKGENITAVVDRVRSGKRESASVTLRVAAVLPIEALGTDAGYVPLEFLLAVEDYRDGKAVPYLSWPGDTSGHNADYAPLPGSESPRHLPDPYARVYSSFRLYAKSLDDVEPLRVFFQKSHIEVYVKSSEIETVQSLDRAFTLVFALIAGASMAGFSAATASSALAGVKRKARSFGVLRLMGFSRGGLMLFPLAQTFFTAVFGFITALILYTGIALSIDRIFHSALPQSETICRLPAEHAIIAFIAIFAISAIAATLAAWRIIAIEPSEVIRDV